MWARASGLYDQLASVNRLWAGQPPRAAGVDARLGDGRSAGSDGSFQTAGEGAPEARLFSPSGGVHSLSTSSPHAVGRVAALGASLVTDVPQPAAIAAGRARDHPPLTPVPKPALAPRPAPAAAPHGSAATPPWPAVPADRARMGAQRQPAVADGLTERLKAQRAARVARAEVPAPVAGFATVPLPTADLPLHSGFMRRQVSPSPHSPLRSPPPLQPLNSPFAIVDHEPHFRDHGARYPSPDSLPPAVPTRPSIYDDYPLYREHTAPTHFFAGTHRVTQPVAPDVFARPAAEHAEAQSQGQHADRVVLLAREQDRRRAAGVASRAGGAERDGTVRSSRGREDATRTLREGENGGVGGLGREEDVEEQVLVQDWLLLPPLERPVTDGLLSFPDLWRPGLATLTPSYVYLVLAEDAVPVVAFAVQDVSRITRDTSHATSGFEPFFVELRGGERWYFAGTGDLDAALWTLKLANAHSGAYRRSSTLADIPWRVVLDRLGLIRAMLDQELDMGRRMDEHATMEAAAELGALREGVIGTAEAEGRMLTTEEERVVDKIMWLEHLNQQRARPGIEQAELAHVAEEERRVADELHRDIEALAGIAGEYWEERVPYDGGRRYDGDRPQMRQDGPAAVASRLSSNTSALYRQRYSVPDEPEDQADSPVPPRGHHTVQDLPQPQYESGVSLSGPGEDRRESRREERRTRLQELFLDVEQRFIEQGNRVAMSEEHNQQLMRTLSQIVELVEHSSDLRSSQVASLLARLDKLASTLRNPASLGRARHPPSTTTTTSLLSESTPTPPPPPPHLRTSSLPPRPFATAASRARESMVLLPGDGRMAPRLVPRAIALAAQGASTKASAAGTALRGTYEGKCKIAGQLYGVDPSLPRAVHAARWAAGAEAARRARKVASPDARLEAPVRAAHRAPGGELAERERVRAAAEELRRGRVGMQREGSAARTAVAVWEVLDEARRTREEEEKRARDLWRGRAR